MIVAPYQRVIVLTLRHAGQTVVLFAAFLFSSTPVVEAQEISERLKEIEGYAMAGDLDRIHASIEKYKNLETIDSDSKVQWRLLRAYDNLFSELSCRKGSKEQKAAIEAESEGHATTTQEFRPPLSSDHNPIMIDADIVRGKPIKSIEVNCKIEYS